MTLTSQVKNWYIKTMPGQNSKVEDLDLKTKWVEKAQNCRFEEEPGSLDKREPLSHLNDVSMGTDPVVGLYRYYASTGLATWVTVCGTTAYSISDSGTATAIRTGLTDGKRCSFATYQDLLICSNGYDNPWTWDGDTTNNVTWELGGCKAVLGAAGGSLEASKDYYYSITLDADAVVNGAFSNTVTTDASKKTIELTEIPLGPTGTTNRKIYRTEGDGSSLKLVATLADNTTTTYSDTVADASLTTAYPAVTDDMPKGSILKLHRERLFIAGDPSSPSKIYYSNVYLPHYIQQTTNLDYMEISPDDGDEIMGIPIQLEVMICIKKNSIRKVHVTSAVSGSDPETWYADDPIAWLGSPAQWSITQTPNGVVFLGWDHWYVFDGASAQPLFDEFDTGDILEAKYSDTVGYLHNENFYAAYTDKESAAQRHNRLMVYNLKRTALAYDLWTSTTITGPNCFGARSGDDEVGDLYFGDSVKGYVLKERDTNSTYRLRTKVECNAGTASDVFVGGTENAPYLEIGDSVTPDAIPDGIVIFWDNDTQVPGTGWTEITGLEDKIIKLGMGAWDSSDGTDHTHVLTSSIPMWYGSNVNYGDGNANCVSAHTHEVASTSNGSSPLPRNIKYRMFKSSSNTDTEFPDGAIVMWDQATAPTGYQVLSSVGYYISQDTADLGVGDSSSHSHSFSIPTGTAAGNLAESDSGTNGPRYGHTHTITGALSTETNDTWEVDYVALTFIKKVGETSTWDGVEKYCYALYAPNYVSTSGDGTDMDVSAPVLELTLSSAENVTSSGSATARVITYEPVVNRSGWEEVSTYDDRYLKIGGDEPATGDEANESHTHTGGTFTTSTGSSSWGNGGYHAGGYADPHTHEAVIASANSDLETPPSVTFRLVKKILGKMKSYNDAIESSSYTTGTWTSLSQNINADTLLKLYWNESISGSDDVVFYTRSGATQTACESASWSVGVTDSNGSTITSTANVWFQYKLTFTATDTTSTIPKVYFTDGYVVKYEYHAGVTVAETSVNFEYGIGLRNFDEPSLDKVFKKIITKHAGETGSFTVSWETENSNDEFVVPLDTYPKYWDSYFQDDAMGKEIDFTISKNDLNEFRISEIKGIFSPYGIII